jgi:hypothetical protein
LKISLLLKQNMEWILITDLVLKVNTERKIIVGLVFCLNVIWRGINIINFVLKFDIELKLIICLVLNMKTCVSHTNLYILLYLSIMLN